MGILTSLFSAVSGLNTYGNAMSVIGNNIANVGTVGFKSSHASFADLVSASLGGGSTYRSGWIRGIFERRTDEFYPGLPLEYGEHPGLSDRWEWIFPAGR